MTNNERQEEYFKLIDRLLRCPNGKEPEVLDASADLIDAELIKTIMQVATIMAHENNQESSQFLIFIARQLAKQLGLYPELSTEV
ncbi:hypothetical protein Xen7305DRAFT_00049340 [Xenococcus sp. PCC 7305]|uniref:hypothetical protein n=1 Tax=Xenococcus sp. PCC 7305 TaxID=102125 RepID=UPI0002ACF1CA|nr:hypothetical protein [Xenococcus sp. PCC 7305]ELS05191.1 hypothetical protein Xen7305DRAFT_00049340 [Xenococcus sp. PCC 7305]